MSELNAVLVKSTFSEVNDLAEWIYAYCGLEDYRDQKTNDAPLVSDIVKAIGRYDAYREGSRLNS